ncbi:MAG: hypothetical protein ACREPE_14915, partial [Lysobacter sp.]
MVDLKMERPKLSAAQLKPLLMAAMVLGLVLATWFGWNAWDLHRDSMRRETVKASRDTAVQTARSGLAAEQKRFAQQLASPGVQRALAAGDLTAAGVELTMGWTDATAGAVLPPDLSAAYTALDKPGAKSVSYGRLAALEAALAADQPVAWLVRDGVTTRLALAAPARHQDRLLGVASALLPLQRVSAGIDGANVPDDTYLALRQGSANVVERGDKALAGTGEALAAKIPGSDRRVAAAVPDVAGGPLGLSAVGCAIAAALSVLLALFAWFGPALL